MPRSSAGTEAFTGPDALSTAHDLRAANLFCARLARGHYENFPVASRLVPARLRPAGQAIYAFARIADDFADEETPAGSRIERLDEWRRVVGDSFRGGGSHPGFGAPPPAGLTLALPR